MGWITGPDSIARGRGAETARGVALAALSVPADYRALHKYLADRFADNVVLRFAEIEDLLGFTLPTAASLELEWWAAEIPGGTPSPQARAWIAANRIATPNLKARTVSFERGHA
jgi:hypothetical protein